MATPSDRRDLPHFNVYIEKIIAAREFSYEAKHSIIFFLEDNTDAENDALALSSCLHDIFGATVIVLEVPSDDMTPAKTLQNAIN